MFTAGVFVSSGTLNYNVITVCSLLIAAAILGNITGYWFGKKTGPLLYKRKDSKFFKQKHFLKHNFFYCIAGVIYFLGINVHSSNFTRLES